MTPPVSGCARRRRSSASSAVPATSMTTGPSGIDLAAGIVARLEHHARAREARFVTDRYVIADDAFAPHEILENRLELEPGFACAVLHDADALKRHRITETGAHGLGKRFLGSEAVGHEKHWPRGFF